MKLDVPAYGQRLPASEACSRAKSELKRSKTKPEVLLAKALRSLGLRARCANSKLPGRPDFVFPRKKLVIFCDGDFWHGKNWTKRKAKLLLGWNSDYWVPKIEYNRRRDRRNTRLLRKAGWKVIRLWESDISKNPRTSATKVIKLLKG